MTATEVAAWWGASVASSVLVWDIIKWNMKGSRLNISASPNMESFGGDFGVENDQTYIIITVSNRGDRKTTLTHVVGYYYKNRLQKLRNKHKKAFLVTSAAFAKPIPLILDVGEQWTGGIIQEPELEDLSRKGYLYCGVFHSSSKKPILVRVVINAIPAT